VARAPAPTSAGPLPPTTGLALPEPSGSGAEVSFNLSVSGCTQTAEPAPSLVTGRAQAPERGWTLLAEPERPDGAGTAVLPPPPTGKGLLDRPRAVLIAGAAALLLLLVGVVLILTSLLKSSPPPDNPPPVVADNGGKNPPAGENEQPKDKKEKEQPKGKKEGPKGKKEEKKEKKVEKKDPDPKELPGVKLRPVVVKPGMPMTIPAPRGRGGVALSTYPNGYVAVADKGGHTFDVWDLTTMKKAHTFEATSGMEEPLALSLDGRWLAGRVGDKVRLCDAEGKVRTLPIPDGHTEWLGFAGAYRLVIVRNRDPGRGILVWDLKANKLVATFPWPDWVDPKTLAISPDGRFLVLPQRDSLLVQELREGADATIRPLPKAEGDPGQLNCLGLAFSPDGRQLAVLLGRFRDTRLVSMDWKKRTVIASHPVPEGSYDREVFYRAPPLDWLPDQSGCLLFGQAVVDMRTGKLRGKTNIDHFWKGHIARTLNDRHVLLVEQTEVRISPLPGAAKK
jgi:hypothetical protein